MAFNDSTRQNMRIAGGALAYNSLQSSIMPIPRVGFLGRLHWHITGTMTVTLNTGTAALGSKAPWSLIRRLSLIANNGISIFNTSGWGQYLVDILQRPGYEQEDGQVSAAYSAQIYAAAAAAGANAWEFGATVPIVANERDIAGLLLLQSEGLVINYQVDWQAGGGATQDFPVVLTGNATATFTGNMSVYAETFTIPGNLEDFPPIDTVFQTLEKVDNIGTIGENRIQLMRANTYVRVIHSIMLNGALNITDIDSAAFTYNRTETPYLIDRKMHLQRTRARLTRDLPVGTWLWEFFDQGYFNYGGGRDLVDATALAELESLINVASGATLGSGNNTVSTITQQFVRLPAPMM